MASSIVWKIVIANKTKIITEEERDNAPGETDWMLLLICLGRVLPLRSDIFFIIGLPDLLQ
jgi:hypothetical protein